MSTRPPETIEPVPSWSTVGRDIHKQKKIPARIISGAEGVLWERALADESRFKLALLFSGNGVLDADGARHVLIAPAAVFLPHRRAIRLPPNAPGAEDRLILFHPCYIYDRLGFEDRASDPNDPASFQDGYLLARFYADRPVAERIVLLEPSQAQAIKAASDRMQAELAGQPDAYWPCRARSFLLEILIACARLAESQDGPALATAASTPELSPIFDFLVSRLNEKLTVDKIARAFNTNRTSLQEKIRRITGLPVTQYLIRLRVQTAAVLLRNTSLAIAEIMERTGFNDESHFSRSFRKFADRSPSEYREAFLVPAYVK